MSKVELNIIGIILGAVVILAVTVWAFSQMFKGMGGF